MSNRSSNSRIGVIVPSVFESKFLDPEGFGGAQFCVSGMGKVNGACAVADMAKRGCSTVLLSGLAGGLRDLSIGDVVSVERIMEGDYDARPVEDVVHYVRPKRITARWTKIASIVTQDRFLMINPYGFMTMAPYPLATDMESYGVAAMAERLGVRAYVTKIISDVADGDAHKDFMTACKRQAKRLNDVISNSIEEIKKDIENGS